MHAVPQILRVMRPFPYFVDLAETLAAARSLMREHDIGHLPVKDGGRLIGILAESDLRPFTRTADRLAEHTVAEAYAPAPFIVPIHARLDEVVQNMARRGADAVLVVKDDHLAGILTTTDVCHILGALLTTGAIPDYDERWREPPPEPGPA